MAELAVPVQSNDPVSLFWVGRTANAEAFGKAWDIWRTETADPNSVAGKLEQRFQKCTTQESRHSYDIY